MSKKIRIAVVGLAHFDAGRLSPLNDQGLTGLFLGAATVFFAYEGFELICYDRDDMHDPARTLPRSLYLSVAIVAVLCALLVYEWRAGRVRWWVPARRVVGFWGTLGGDLYEVRRAQSGGLELISSGETLPVSIRAPRQFCVGAPGAAVDQSLLHPVSRSLAEGASQEAPHRLDRDAGLAWGGDGRRCRAAPRIGRW